MALAQWLGIARFRTHGTGPTFATPGRMRRGQKPCLVDRLGRNVREACVIRLYKRQDSGEDVTVAKRVSSGEFNDARDCVA